MFYYSPTTNGFYLKEIHGDNIPTDAVEITEQEHAALMAAQGEGQAIKPSDDGNPVASVPSATWDQIRDRRDAELAASDWTQLPDVPLSEEQVTAWRAYRQQLREITSSAESPDDVVWPTAP